MNDKIYQIITDTILEKLESGVVPWKKPWNTGNHAPRSANGHVYRGINTFLLQSQDYASSVWLTRNQIGKFGGKIVKGESGTPIIFWKMIQVKNDGSDDPDSDTEETEGKEVPLLRYYKVWNLLQTEGVDIDTPEDEFSANHFEEECHQMAENVVADYKTGPTIEEVGNSAWYKPSSDRIVVPPRKTFGNLDQFYGALFHELGHSTAHPSRLNRSIDYEFGSHSYGREELVAEMTSSFLSAYVGIQSTIPNSASYLQSWMRTIREDNRAVIVAASAAQRAADHILCDGN